MNIENLDAVMCVFCEGIVADKIDYTQTQYCVDCNEYKGITTVREYILEYGYQSDMASTIAYGSTVAL
jgi:hypothetical protein